ncbi:MobA/MobL family protein [Sinorhizobium medicae]|uniref:MobA/MobL family protein n=1 Tax=Sinorhizobium medicae TaxID=110321 RepID=UPI002AF6AFC0|nr:MobA/MobL family protein [Sinorhizobium medicae]WQO60096.1 MobA/MobL family protein [Sinorhizobium medicae]
MVQFGYFRLEHSSFNRDEWGYGRVANAAHYGANQNKRGHVATVGIPLYGTSHETRQAVLELEKLNTRKNARLGDTLIICFPKEVSESHRLLMMERFLSKVTFEGRTYAIAWEHTDKPDNPHFHVVLMDRDRITGKSVGKFGHSRSYRKQHGLEPNVTDWMRMQWEDTGNELFKELGYELAFDRRSNLERGLDAPGEHRGHENDNTPDLKAEPAVEELEDLAERAALEALEALDDDSATEEPHDGDEAMGKVTSDLVGVTPAETIKFLHTQRAELAYIHQAKKSIQEARDRYDWLVSEREKISAEAGDYNQASLPTLISAHVAQERLSEHQTDTGELKGRSFGLFGLTVFRTAARKQAEVAQREARAAQLEANRVEHTRRSYEHKIGQISAQATKAEREAHSHCAVLDRLYGNDQMVKESEEQIGLGISEAVVMVTLEQAVMAYGEGEITEDEYRTFLIEGGYEAELEFLEQQLGREESEGQSL